MKNDCSFFIISFINLKKCIIYMIYIYSSNFIHQLFNDFFIIIIFFSFHLFVLNTSFIYFFINFFISILVPLFYRVLPAFSCISLFSLARFFYAVWGGGSFLAICGGVAGDRAMEGYFCNELYFILYYIKMRMTEVSQESDAKLVWLREKQFAYDNCG